MKSALLIICLFLAAQLQAATIALSQLPATNATKLTDYVVLEVFLSGTNYTTRRQSIGNLITNSASLGFPNLLTFNHTNSGWISSSGALTNSGLIKTLGGLYSISSLYADGPTTFTNGAVTNWSSTYLFNFLQLGTNAGTNSAIRWMSSAGVVSNRDYSIENQSGDLQFWVIDPSGTHVGASPKLAINATNNSFSVNSSNVYLTSISGSGSIVARDSVTGLLFATNAVAGGSTNGVLISFFDLNQFATNSAGWVNIKLGSLLTNVILSGITTNYGGVYAVTKSADLWAVRMFDTNRNTGLAYSQGGTTKWSEYYLTNASSQVIRDISPLGVLYGVPLTVSSLNMAMASPSRPAVFDANGWLTNASGSATATAYLRGDGTLALVATNFAISTATNWGALNQAGPQTNYNANFYWLNAAGAGSTLAIDSSSGKLYRTNVVDYSIGTATITNSIVFPMTFSPTNGTVISGRADTNLYTWDLSKPGSLVVVTNGNLQLSFTGTVSPGLGQLSNLIISNANLVSATLTNAFTNTIVLVNDVTNMIPFGKVGVYAAWDVGGKVYVSGTVQP